MFVIGLCCVFASKQIGRHFFLDWLENALSRGYSAWRFVAEHSEIFASLRADPRFIEIVRRMRESSESLARELAI